jgi:hypothetical protein
MVYYQPGIGTYESSQSIIPFSIYKIIDEMFAWSIDTHIKCGYKFLMEHYVLGDKIFLFGFSRGAYTARSLAGMLQGVGLLPAGNLQQVSFAYKIYKAGKKKESEDFKNAFSVEVPIDFIGVWDTVSSVGFFPRVLPLATPRTMTRIFRHALSLDERRAKFQANFWGSHHRQEIEAMEDLESQPVDRTRKAKQLGDGTPENIKEVEEVWFAGCHCDVGGSSVLHSTRYSLARISLRWMIRECYKANTGIKFHEHSFSRIGIDPFTLSGVAVANRPVPLDIEPHRIQRPPPISICKSIRAFFENGDDDTEEGKPAGEPRFKSEEEEELHDAVSPKYDQLRRKRGWWIVEILPLPQVKRGPRGTWVDHYWPHFARPRKIPNRVVHEIKIHRSVKLRMQAEFQDERARKKGKKYIPRALFDIEKTSWAHDVKVTWVD